MKAHDPSIWLVAICVFFALLPRVRAEQPLQTAGNSFQPLFFARLDYQVGIQPSAVCAQDFDGDGSIDVAVANASSYSNSVSILLNKGNGVLDTAISYSVSGGPQRICVLDFDVDGRPDLAVASASGQVTILRNLGNGSFASAGSYAVGLFPTGIVPADFNGDGWPDLAVANGWTYSSFTIDSTVSILVNKGDGAFAPAVNYQAAPAPNSLSLGDFNSDGYPDLAVGFKGDSSGGVAILINSGSGAFGNPTVHFTQPSNFVSFPSVATIDANGDVHDDLALCGDGRLTIFTNSGAGSLDTAKSYWIGGLTQSLCVADLDGDGKQDIVVTSSVDGSSAVLFKSNGDGTYSRNVFEDVQLGTDPHSMIAADINGDAKLDIIVANRHNVGSFEASTVSTLFNMGNMSFMSSFEQSGSDANALCAADFDEDGTTEIRVFTQETIGCAADFDGNGRPDYATAQTMSDGSVKIYLNHGGGVFDTPASYSAGGACLAIAAGDFSGDNRPDIAVTHSDGKVTVLSNDGFGAFLESADYDLSERAYALCLADFDGDGPIDLGIAKWDDWFSVLKNRGDGTFENPVEHYKGYGIVESVISADLNGDLKPDVAMTGMGPTGSDQFTILFNQGNGTLGSPVRYRGLIDAHGIVHGDFGGNGSLDLAVVSSFNDMVSIYINNGSGTFVGAGNYGVGPNPSCIVSADIDGDGATDLAVSHDGGYSALMGRYPFNCCVGLTGNVDCDPGSGIDISDLSALVDNLYISLMPLCCPATANIDGQPGIDISDLSALIDYLYISFTPPAACQ